MWVIILERLVIFSFSHTYTRTKKSNKTFAGVCTKQACSLTSGEWFVCQGMSVAQQFLFIVIRCDTFYLLSKNCSSCYLDIALSHTVILIMFWSIVQPYFQTQRQCSLKTLKNNFPLHHPKYVTMTLIFRSCRAVVGKIKNAAIERSLGLLNSCQYHCSVWWLLYVTFKAIVCMEFSSLNLCEPNSA